MNLLEWDLDELLEVVRAIPVAYDWKRVEAIGRKLVDAEDVKGEAAEKAVKFIREQVAPTLSEQDKPAHLPPLLVMADKLETKVGHLAGPETIMMHMG